MSQMFLLIVYRNQTSHYHPVGDVKQKRFVVKCLRSLIKIVYSGILNAFFSFLMQRPRWNNRLISVLSRRRNWDIKGIFLMANAEQGLKNTVSRAVWCLTLIRLCLFAARLCSEQDSNCILISLELKNTILLNQMPNVNEILIRVSFTERRLVEI